MHNAIVIVNLLKVNAQDAAEEIRTELKSRGVDVTTLSFEGRPGAVPEGKWDIAFSLGGDGTVLYSARILAGSATPILPIHLGTLGFLSGVEMSKWLSVYEAWLNPESHSLAQMRVSPRSMLSLSVSRTNSILFHSTCLNDTVISSSGKAKLIRLRVRTQMSSAEDGSPLAAADLGYYRSDGLVIATPTGSTAYSMAAGGPIVDPEMEAVVISPVCPFTLSNRPLVLPSRQTLIITVEKEQRSDIVLTVDGQVTFDLEPGDVITVDHFPRCTNLITTGRSSYYLALKEKLSWGEHNVR